MTDTTSFPIERMSERAFGNLVEAERDRWLAGLPLLHRKALTAHFGIDPEAMFQRDAEREAEWRAFKALTPAQRLAFVDARIAQRKTEDAPCR